MNRHPTGSTIERPPQLKRLLDAPGRIRSYFSQMSIASSLRLDVIIPAADKDLDVLPYALDGVTANLRHPIGSIFVVAPSSKALHEVCRRKHCRFVEERSFYDMNPAEIDMVVNGVDRSTWIYQQLLKLSADTLTESSHFLVVDADTVFVRPQAFERNGRVILNYSDEYNQPYFEMYQRLLNEVVVCPVSFTSHQMLYDTTILRDLKRRIEAIHGCRWDEAILRKLDRSQEAGFSDYDTYGQFAFMHHPQKVAVEYWFNLSLARKRNLAHVRWLRFKYGRKYKSLSFHSYKE